MAADGDDLPVKKFLATVRDAQIALGNGSRDGF